MESVSKEGGERGEGRGERGEGRGERGEGRGKSNTWILREC